MFNKIEGFYLVSEVVSGSFVSKFFLGSFAEASKAANEIRVTKHYKTKVMAPCDYQYWMGN
jgi:hypothetical protein